MPFLLVHEDITKLQVDAIVNAANSDLRMGGGVCGAIFDAAGSKDLQAACNAYGHCDTGNAVITMGFNALSTYIIHAVGPVWQGGSSHEPELLRKAYLASLQLAVSHDCESIAFPLISGGIYGYPKREALQIAKETITEFLETHDLMVYMVLFDRSLLENPETLHFKDSFMLSEDEAYSNLAEPKLYSVAEEQLSAYSSVLTDDLDLEALFFNQGESFSSMLLRLIDEKGLTDVQVYRKANIDRRHFSKMRSQLDYSPKKTTVIAFAIALELDYNETQQLLASAGYTLTRSIRFDQIIAYFIDHELYNVYTINDTLFFFNQPLLGSL